MISLFEAALSVVVDDDVEVVRLMALIEALALPVMLLMADMASEETVETVRFKLAELKKYLFVCDISNNNYHVHFSYPLMGIGILETFNLCVRPWNFVCSLLAEIW